MKMVILGWTLKIALISPPQDIALVEPQSIGSEAGPDDRSESARQPQHCVLLRSGGVMSVLDLDQGSEVTLAEDIECFWLSGPSRRPPPSQPPPSPGLSRFSSAPSQELTAGLSGQGSGLMAESPVSAKAARHMGQGGAQANGHASASGKTSGKCVKRVPEP